MGKKVVASWNRGQTNFTKENNPLILAEIKSKRSQRKNIKLYTRSTG